MGKEDKKLADAWRLAQRRSGTIPTMVKYDGVYFPATPEKTQQAVRFFGRFIGDMNISGEGFVDQARKMAEGGRLLVVSNHQTDVDPTSRRLVLGKIHHEDLADRLVHPAGLKMLERWFPSLFLGAEAGVFIPTPADSELVNEMLKRNDLSRVQREGFLNYRTHLASLGRAAKAEFGRLESRGRVTGLYPEAGRTYDKHGYMKKSPKVVALYAMDEKTVVLPMSVDGLYRVFPAGRIPRLHRKANLDVSFGAPFLASEAMWDPQVRAGLEEMGAQVSDVFVSRIGLTNPRIINPDEQAFYRQVFEISERARLK